LKKTLAYTSFKAKPGYIIVHSGNSNVTASRSLYSSTKYERGQNLF